MRQSSTVYSTIKICIPIIQYYGIFTIRPDCNWLLSQLWNVSGTVYRKSKEFWKLRNRAIWISETICGMHVGEYTSVCNVCVCVCFCMSMCNWSVFTLNILKCGRVYHSTRSSDFSALTCTTQWQNHNNEASKAFPAVQLSLKSSQSAHFPQSEALLEVWRQTVSEKNVTHPHYKMSCSRATVTTKADDHKKPI